MSGIKKVAVIGSGVMGSQIAAHITNAGIPVILLDIVLKDKPDRNFLVNAAVEKLKKTDPSPFMHPKNAKLITVGNLEDNLTLLSDVDWIIEAVLENPQIKSDLYKKVDSVRKAGSIVSSNTSTIPLAILTGGQSDQFSRDFLITHFFNPPRYMRLLELVVGSKTDKENAQIIRDFGDIHLGKGVVMCNDTPGFIANRLGVFFIQAAINAAYEFGLKVEEADAVFSKPAGMPKTGIFGLLDLIGIDLIPLIAKSFLATLPQDDAYRALNVPHPVIDKMIADGYTGRKGKGGFYRMTKTENGKIFEAIDLHTGEYRPSDKKFKPRLIEEAGGDLRKICESETPVGKFAWKALSAALVYAASLVPQIADNIADVDEGMRLGFNWKYGPFELIDKVGASWLIDRMKAEGRPIPAFLQSAAGRTFYRVEKGRLEFLATSGDYKPVVRPDGVLLLQDIKRGSQPVIKCGSSSLWDIGDGVLCLEFHTKMNAIDTDLLGQMQKVIDLIKNYPAKYKGLVIHNESEAFSAGANLGLVLFSTNIAAYKFLEDFMRQGQETYRSLRFAPFPSVAAPSGIAFGGGCEVTLHCSAVQAHAELYMGLVEVGVGLVPAWGGCAQMLGRAFGKKKRLGGPIPPVAQVFETIGLAKRSSSAFEARELMYLRETDGISMNKDRLLYDAKQRVLELAKNYKVPEQISVNLPGPTGRAALGMVVDGMRLLGKATPHDVTVCKVLGSVLCGGDKDFTTATTEEQILENERQGIIKLIRTEETVARIAHMLNIGKPLRN